MRSTAAAPHRVDQVRRWLAWTLMGWAALLSGCAQRWPAGLDVDTSITAVSQDSRVRFIVLHYTAGNNAASLLTLAHGDVSVHYLITDGSENGTVKESGPVKVYRLVPEDRDAWHAGESSWYGHTAVNNSSIGIEIVNPGWAPGPDGTPPQWHDYSEAQIRAVMLLIGDIARRHQILPENIVGHSDVAPERKTDPGPRFPWKRLAQAGLGRWFDEEAAARFKTQFDQQGVPDTSWFQAQLERVGYAVPHTAVLDPATIKVIAAFQMHYRQGRFDGVPDAETAGILQALP